MTLAAVPEMRARASMPRTKTRFTVYPPCDRTPRAACMGMVRGDSCVHSCVDSFVPHHDLRLDRDGSSGGGAGVDEPDDRPDVDELVGIADGHADLRAG